MTDRQTDRHSVQLLTTGLISNNGKQTHQSCCCKNTVTKCN